MEQTTIYIIVIIILLSLLILSILGAGMFINIINWFINAFKVIFDFILSFLGSLSKNTGEIINGTSDVVTDTGIFGLELIDGVMNNIGNMFKGKATPVSSDGNHLDIIIQNKNDIRNHHVNLPEPANIYNTNQKWCYVGENSDGSTTCAKLYANQSCQSNQIYNNENDCQIHKKNV